MFRPSATTSGSAQAIPHARLRPPSLEEAALAFHLSRQAQGCTESTLIWYGQYVPALTTYLETHGYRDLEAVTPDLLRQWIVHLQARGLAPHSVHHHASAARAFFRFLESEGMLAQNPMATVKMPRLPKVILPAFGTDDVQGLLRVAKRSDYPLRDEAIILCLLDTGARASEFVALDMGDVDLKSGCVMIRQGKGRKDRATFLGAKARKALLKYLMQRSATVPALPLWLSQTQERLTTTGLRQLLQRLGKRAEVANCHPHTFRRTCALWSLRAGMNIFALQQLMGHTDLKVLQQYLALLQQDLQGAHQKYGAVDSTLPRR